MSDTEISGTELKVAVIAENEKKITPSRKERFQKRQQQTVTLEQDDSCDTVLREAGIDTSGMSKKEKQQLVQILQMSKEDTTQTGSWGLHEESSQERKGKMVETNKGGDESNEEDLIEEMPCKPSPLKEMDFTDWLSSHKSRSNSSGPPTKQTAVQVKPFMRQTAKLATKRTVSVKNESCKSDLGDGEGRPLKQRKIDQFSHIVIPDEDVSVDSQNQSQNCQQIHHDKTHTSAAMEDDTQPPDSPDIFQSQPYKYKEGNLQDNKDGDDEEATQNYDAEDLENEEQKSKEGLHYEIKALHRHYRKVKRKYKTRQAYYAPPEVDPRDYTKVILQLFEIYHRKLSEAQARVDTYLSWGDGIRVGRHMADSIGVWRKRNIYREDFSSDEADFVIEKPKPKSLSEDNNINSTDVGIPSQAETTTRGKSNMYGMETQPFDQSYNPMEIEAEFCDDNIDRPDSRNSLERKEVANDVLEQDVSMTEQRDDKEVQIDEREKHNRKTLYSESLEKFIPVDKGLSKRRWSSIMNENDSNEGHALININADCSRKRRPVRLARKREKILTKERKKPVEQFSDSSRESFPFDEIDCNTEVANLTKNQLQNTSVDGQTYLEDKFPRTRSRTQNTSQSTNSRSPVDRPPSETSNTSRESLSQSSAYMLDPQGELYSTQACVLRGKLENTTEKKQKYVNIRTYSRRGKNKKKETDRKLGKEKDDTVKKLENSDNESDQMAVNSRVLASKSEETESSRDSTDINFSIMQPTLIDDDVDCFETKSHLQVKKSTVNISCIDDYGQAENILTKSGSSSSPESVDKMDSQSPDFKKSKIFKKIVTCTDTESSDDIILISPKRNPASDAEGTLSGNQLPVPGPSWLKPNRRNLLTPVLETSNQDEEVGDTTDPQLEQTDQKVKCPKDKNTASLVLRKRSRNTKFAGEGRKEMYGSERELRGKKDIWSRTRKGEKNASKETGDNYGGGEADQFERIDKSKEELDADHLLKNEGILVQDEGREEKSTEIKTTDRRREGRMNRDVAGCQQKTTQSKMRGENKEVDDELNRNNDWEGSGSEGKIEQSFGENRSGIRRGRGRGRKVEQQNNKRRVVEQPVDNIATNQDIEGGRKRAMEKDEDVEIEIKIHKEVEEMPCPLCNKSFPLDKIEQHAAECNGDTAEDGEVVLTPPNSNSNIVVDPGSGPTTQEEDHQSSHHDSQSSQHNLNDGSGSQQESNPSDVNMVTCYICDEEFAKGQEYSKHIDRCLEEAKRRQQEADLRKYKIPRLTEERRSTRSKKKDSGDSLLGRLDEAWTGNHSDGYSSESNEEESQTLREVIQSNFKNPKTKISDVSDSLDESESSYESTPDNSQSDDLLPGGWTLEELKNSPIKTYIPISAQGDSDGFMNQYSKAKARYERQLQRQESNTSKKTRGKVKKRGKKRKRKSSAAKGKKKSANKRKRTV